MKRFYKIYHFGEDARKDVISPPYVISSYLELDRNRTLPRRDPDTSLSDLIDSIRNLTKVSFSGRIADRLLYLLEVSREEQPEQAPPAAASLKGFLSFLAKNAGLAYPDIVLTPDGNIRAQWKGSSRQNFALEFLEDNDVRFVVFAPNPRRPYKMTRVSGAAMVDSVTELVAPYRILDWIQDAGANAA